MFTVSNSTQYEIGHANFNGAKLKARLIQDQAISSFLHVEATDPSGKVGFLTLQLADNGTLAVNFNSANGVFTQA